MDTKRNKEEKFTQSLTFKALVIAVLILLLFIPNVMIQDLISERQSRSQNTIEKINEKWSLSQIVSGPILTLPFTKSDVDSAKKVRVEKHELHLMPENLDISTQLFPEERHYGIYKTILYKSEILIKGRFKPLNELNTVYNAMHLNEACLSIGVSDLRGVTDPVEMQWNGKSYQAEAGGSNSIFKKMLIIRIEDTIASNSSKAFSFECRLRLKGSSSIEFIPVGQTTKVEVKGKWQAPGFIGSFSPDYTLTEEGFLANWSILSFNRSIPEYWIDNSLDSAIGEYTFGVNLVNTVDHYQQNMRSAKYSLMFIVLSFVVFFFVEVVTQKRIHPVQYLLAGIALILFYSLLLSISEQINFAIAYLIASVATIALITTYAHSIFKNAKQTGILALILIILYIFLYIILQLEDVALLIGSVGLFIILGIIMFLSRKIKWYKQESTESVQICEEVDH